MLKQHVFVSIGIILRALDLERDWLEVATERGEHIRVFGVGEVVDDLIGPMVNHPVTVQVRREGKSGRYSFVDIESDD